MVVLVCAGTLAVAPAASAKLCATVTVAASRPAAGQTTEVRLTTWFARWSGGRAQFARHAASPTSRRFRVRVESPRGAPFAVVLRRDRSRPWLWRGRFRFVSAGRWLLRPDARYWAAAPRSCAPVVAVTVQPS